MINGGFTESAAAGCSRDAGRGGGHRRAHLHHFQPASTSPSRCSRRSIGGRSGCPCGPTPRSSVGVGDRGVLLLAGAFYAGMMGGGDVKLAAALALWFRPATR
jgi:hypothetical protein